MKKSPPSRSPALVNLTFRSGRNGGQTRLVQRFLRLPNLAFFARLGTQQLGRGEEPDFKNELSKRINLGL